MRTIFRQTRYGFALAVLPLVLAGCGSDVAPGCGELAVSDAWVRASAPGAKVMGAYFVLANEGDTLVTVNAIKSVQFERVEMHETIINDSGQASMQPLARVTVAPDASVGFEPGGKHLMLFSPSQVYTAGDQVELILSCGKQNADLPVAAVVRAQSPAHARMNHKGMNHQGMNHGADRDAPEEQ